MGETRGEPGTPPSRFDLDWIGFGEAYTAVQEEREKPEGEGTVAAYMADLVANHLNEHIDRTPGGANPSGNAEGATCRRAVERRARLLAAKLLVVMVTEPGGVAGCLKRANRWDGFDWLRDHLEEHGFARPVAWRVTLALHHKGIIRPEPNRPYLDRSGLALTHCLVHERSFRDSPVREWEAVFMVQADAHLSSLIGVAKLDAELVTRAFRELAAKTNGRIAPGRSSPANPLPRP